MICCKSMCNLKMHPNLRIPTTLIRQTTQCLSVTQCQITQHKNFVLNYILPLALFQVMNKNCVYPLILVLTLSSEMLQYMVAHTSVNMCFSPWRFQKFLENARFSSFLIQDSGGPTLVHLSNGYTPSYFLLNHLNSTSSCAYRNSLLMPSMM